MENDFYDFVRDKLPRDTVEDIKLIDNFTKEDRTSHCYRLTYRYVLVIINSEKFLLSNKTVFLFYALQSVNFLTQLTFHNG